MIICILTALISLVLGMLIGSYLSRRNREATICQGVLYVQKTPGGKVVTFDVLDEDPEQLDRYETVALRVLTK